MRLGYDLLDPEAHAGAGGSAAGASVAPGKGGASASGGSADSGGEPGDFAGAGGLEPGGGAAGGSSGTSGSPGGGGSVGGDGAGGTGPVSTPPIAALSVTPSVGDTTTGFSADASGSSDGEDAIAALTFDWDWESDGTYDASGVNATHTYGAPGDYTVTLRVTDSGGDADTATAQVSVVAAGDLLIVTTGVDEQDLNATQADPMGAGFSLREAVMVSDTLAGNQTIYVPADTVPSIDLTLGLIEVTSTADIFGYGAAIDGTGLSGSADCLVVSGVGVRVFGFEISGCPDSPVAITGGSNNQVSDCFMRDNGGGVASSGGTGHVIGPNNLVETSGAQGVFVNVPTSVLGNVIRDTVGACMQMGGGGPGSTVRGNLCLRTQTGIGISSNADNLIVVNNTIDSARGNGVVLAAQNLLLANNSITNGADLAVIATDAGLNDASNANLTFNNAGGVCNTGCSLGALARTDDPLYADPQNDDFRPGVGSPLIDNGVDLGHDLNGSAAGNFNGANPDIGYYEAL